MNVRKEIFQTLGHRNPEKDDDDLVGRMVI